jgi:hypothetical protein
MDSTFYNRFYSKMTKGTFIGMTKATPEKFLEIKRSSYSEDITAFKCNEGYDQFESRI